MNKLPTLTVIVFFFFSLGSVFPAETFSADRTAFVNEMANYLVAKDDKELEKLMTSLQNKLNGNQLCERAFQSMVGTCNRMAQLKLPVKPYFPSYLQSICVWNGNCGEQCVLEDWNEVHASLLDHLPNRNFKPFGDFLDFSIAFFQSNALHFQRGGVLWKVTGADCHIAWDGRQPMLQVGETTLEAAWKKGKITLEKTSGIYFPLTLLWSGKGGIVRWNRFDSLASTFCILADYQVDLGKKEYVAEHAVLVYPALFGEKRIPGKFSDKLLADPRGEENTYPRFASYDAVWEIPNFSEGVCYRGGFALQGSTLQGISAAGKQASLAFFSKTKTRIATLRSDLFLLRQGGSIAGQGVEAVVYFGENDSLYHPAINLKYAPGDKMSFFEGEKSASKSPWYDSFHKVFLFAERIDLDLASGNFFINPKAPGQGGAGQRLYVESEEFFDKNLFHRLQNVATIHPLSVIAKMAGEQGDTVFANEIAQRINPNFTVASIQSLLFDLEENGFVRYNPAQEKVVVLNRALYFAGAAVNKKDSDVLRFESTHEGANASIDPLEKTIRVEGVENFFLHTRHKVAVLPKHKQVILRQNRGLDFAGKIFAGQSVLEGGGFHFDYAKFQVTADSVASFDLYLPTGSLDKNGHPETASIGSRIERTSGILLVNAPGNKGGGELLPLFPAFVTTAPAFVFYDQRNEQGSCYDRQHFFFRLNPFTFNHLGDISPEELQFGGTLVSSGIFPDFKEKLVLQSQDKSLGFTTQTPPDGYPAYSKGKFTGSLHLGNSGLRGEGELAYLATSVKANDFLFKPRQATCNAEVFDLKEDFARSIPRVHGEEVNVNWLPQEDSMFITSRTKAFQLFNDGSHEIGGLLIYMPDGLKGRGIFKWGDGQMNSDLFAFGSHTVKTEKTDLQIKAFDTGQLALETKNLKGNINFKENKARFSANEQTELTTMPFNHYITTLNEFEWDLGKKSLTFLAPKGQQGWFLSTDARQDSLQFFGSSATYDFDRGQLDVAGVAEIAAADALIFPASGKVKLLPGGAMEPLQDARIVASAGNKYHQIVNATVTLSGRKDFEATGFYEYDLPGKPQRIELANITGKGSPGSEKAFTQARAVISAANEFFLDGKTRFQGEVSLKSSNPWLGFDGFAKLEIPVLKENQWFEVKFHGDYKKLLVACNEPKNQAGETMRTGLFINSETSMNYARVLMPLASKRDRNIFDAKGVVRFDAATNSYVFGDSAKIANPAAGKGNVLFFSNKTAEVKAEGSFDLCENVEGIDLKVAGSLKTGLDASLLADSTLAKPGMSTDFVAGFDFSLPKPLMKIMLADFATPSFETRPAVYENIQLYRTVLAEWCAKPRKRTDAETELVLHNVLSLPEEDAPATFVLADLKMSWNQELQSFVSTHPNLALVSVDKQGIHQIIEAKVEFHAPANQDDQVFLWLKSAEGHFYYFHYKKGILHLYSDNEAFNEAVKTMKDKDRMIEVKKGAAYELQLTTPDLAAYFVKRRG